MSCNDENPWFVSNLDEFLQYCCPECDDKYQSKETFVLHAFEKHAKAKDCLELRLDSEKVEVVCKKQSEQAISLKIEDIAIEDMVIIAEENFDIKTNSIRKSKKVIDSKKFSCNFCSKVLSSRYERELHIKQAHKDLPELKCDTCNVKFIDENRRKQHMAIVHEGVKKEKEETSPLNVDLLKKVQNDHPGFKCKI